MPSEVKENIEQTGIVSKFTSFISTKKGLYLLGAILLVGAIYYYLSNGKNNKDTEIVQTEIPQPPPGYVTIPVEMLEGLQQGSQYHEIPNNFNQPTNLPTQQQGFQNTQMEINQELHDEQFNMQDQKKAPKLKHNKQIEEDDEEEEIAEQNLSKDEMESIQAQLNAMQQQRENTNSA